MDPPFFVWLWLLVRGGARFVDDDTRDVFFGFIFNLIQNHFNPFFHAVNTRLRFVMVIL